MAASGELQVYSKTEESRDSGNQAAQGMPVWYEHTDYGIYDAGGNFLREVLNSRGHYSRSPEVVILPAGKYMVKAQARGYFWVKVPLTVEAGERTVIHLDGDWTPPVETPKAELVTLPDGKPVGLRAPSS
jgi:hypothetical protein